LRQKQIIASEAQVNVLKILMMVIC